MASTSSKARRRRSNPARSMCPPGSRPVCGAAAQHHLAELPRRFGEELTVPLIDDHSVAADRVEQIDLASAVSLGDQIRVFFEPPLALGSDLRALPCGRLKVEFVLQALRIDRVDNDPVVLAGALDRDVVIDDVLEHECGIALERVTEAATT